MQILLREPEPVAQASNRMRGRGNIQIVAPEKAGNQGMLILCVIVVYLIFAWSF